MLKSSLRISSAVSGGNTAAGVPNARRRECFTCQPSGRRPFPPPMLPHRVEWDRLLLHSVHAVGSALDSWRRFSLLTKSPPATSTLVNSGFDMQKLSIVGRERPLRLRVVNLLCQTPECTQDTSSCAWRCAIRVNWTRNSVSVAKPLVDRPRRCGVGRAAPNCARSGACGGRRNCQSSHGGRLRSPRAYATGENARCAEPDTEWTCRMRCKELKRPSAHPVRFRTPLVRQVLYSGSR